MALLENEPKRSGRLSIAEEWWNKVHRESQRDFLNGAGGEVEIKALKVKPTGTILHVGIGFGQTPTLLAKKYIVDGLDISQIALDDCKVLRNKYLSKNICDLPENIYDFALSYYVSQHMSQVDLLSQLTYVIKSLKEDGIFAMQYTNRNDGELDDCLEKQLGGYVYRTEEEIKELIKKADGVVVYSDSCLFHIKNKTIKEKEDERI